MKARHQFQMRRGIQPAQTVGAGLAENTPNSSATFAASVLADMDDVLAVVRTATLLGKNLKVSTSIDLPGEDAILIGWNDPSQASLPKLLGAIRSKLSKLESSDGPSFALEASITTASFLATGSIFVHVRGIDSVAKRPSLTR